MAIYQFRCQIHGDFEVQQGMTDEHVALCPECRGHTERVYLPFTFYFPDVLFDKRGKKQSADDLPSVPSGTRWTHGWTPDNKEGEPGGN